jgi:hypothetical protein
MYPKPWVEDLPKPKLRYCSNFTSLALFPSLLFFSDCSIMVSTCIKCLFMISASTHLINMYLYHALSYTLPAKLCSVPFALCRRSINAPYTLHGADNFGTCILWSLSTRNADSAVLKIVSLPSWLPRQLSESFLF